jgi:hypothetical protein
MAGACLRKQTINGKRVFLRKQTGYKRCLREHAGADNAFFDTSESAASLSPPKSRGCRCGSFACATWRRQKLPFTGMLAFSFWACGGMFCKRNLLCPCPQKMLLSASSEEKEQQAVILITNISYRKHERKLSVFLYKRMRCLSIHVPMGILYDSVHIMFCCLCLLSVQPFSVPRVAPILA